MKQNTKITKRYCCPHCLTVHLKDPATQMLTAGADEVLRGAYHLDAVKRMANVRCRTCQHTLDFQRLLKGDYDYSDWSADGSWLVGLILLAVLRWSAGWGWWASVGVACGTALVLGMLLSRWQKRRIRAFTR